MLWSTAATSQSTVSNNQVQAGDVFSSQQLDVVTSSSDTSATTTSTGNSLIGSASTGDLDVESTQTMSGSATAGTTINVQSDAGPSLDSLTAATGNSGSSVIDGGGTLSGHFTQSTTGSAIDAESQTNGPQAASTDVAIQAQAIANSQTFGSTDSNVAATTTQSNAASVTANGGAVLGDVTDVGTFSATGAGNNLTSVGAGQSSQTLTADQSNTGQVTQGAMFVNLGNSEVTETDTTATGNNINVSNTQGPLSLTDNQDNESFVHAQSVETSYEYGGATVTADGVGNAAFAGNVGPSVTLNNTQTNGAEGVESSASFNSAGSPGFDAFVSSTATGNAVTGFACSQCGGVMNVTNSQTNLGDAAATTQIGLAAGGRSVRGVATAIGNTATFYTSSPGN